MSAHRFLILATVLATLELAPVANAELAVSANDNKVVLVNGRATVVQNPPPDTVAIIDLKASPPRVVAEIEAPASVVGPPLSVALMPDEGLALVTAAMKIELTGTTLRDTGHRIKVNGGPAAIRTVEK